MKALSFKKQFKLTTLQDSPEFFQATVQMIQEALGYSSINRFDIDFAPLMATYNRQNCHILIDTGNSAVVLHIGILPRELTNGATSTLIGGIACAKEYRGNGLFKQCFDHILDHYMAQTAFFILWSDLTSLYEKFCFFEAGVQVQSGNKLLEAVSVDTVFYKTKLSALKDSECDEIKNIYLNSISKKQTTFIRRDEHWKSITHIKSDLYIKKKKDKIVSYFFINKGQDLEYIVHEFGYINENERDLLVENLKDFKLWLPHNYATCFKTPSLLFMGLFRIGDLKLFNHFLESYAHNDLRVDSINKNKVLFTHNNIQFNDSTEKFLQMIFGPQIPQEFITYGPPLYFSGLDSI